MVFRGGTGEITEKKSRFIATVLPVRSEKEAADFIESIKKKYWDARHNCFAYVIGSQQEIQRYSDDGEPGGTAGKPMLEVLLGEDIHDTAVVVTRYFGGTLLGTGGLVRAYQGAAKKGLSASVMIEKIRGRKVCLKTDYADLGKIQYILGENKIAVLDSVYTEKVELDLLVPEDQLKKLEELLTDGTNGRVFLEEKEDCFYGEIEGKMQILE